MNEIIINFDMDGVAAKWSNSTVKRTHKKRFFLRRKLQVNIRDAIEILNAEFNVDMRTAAYKDAHSAKNKETWLHRKRFRYRYLVIIPYGGNKAKGVNRNNINILVDDYSKNLHEWEANGPGFIGIKFYNGQNGTHGTWTGRSISHEMTAEEIVAYIRNVAYEAYNERLACAA